MKALHLLLLLIVFSITQSCKKTETANTAIALNMASSASIKELIKDSLKISVTQINGDPEQVTVSLSNLPDGLRATINNAKGIPPFTATVAFVQTGKIDPDTYTATAFATSDGGATSQNLKITVGS